LRVLRGREARLLIQTASPYKEAAPFLAQLQTNYEFFFTKKTPHEQKEESQQTRKIRKQDISTNRVIQEVEKFVKENWSR
jgi:hypothetical protein